MRQPEPVPRQSFLRSLGVAVFALLGACAAPLGNAPARTPWPPLRQVEVAVAPPVPAAERAIPEGSLETSAGAETPASEATVAPVVETAPSAAPGEPEAPRDHYEERAPGVHVRAGESQGLAFLEIVLGDVDPTQPLPLVVIIHGRGDRPRVPGGAFESLDTPVRLVVPRAETPIGTGFSWLPVRAADGQTERLSAALRDVSARLAALVADVRATRATLGRTIVTGFSQGGMLTVTLAVWHPQTVGVAFPLAGWLPPPLWPTEPPPPDAPVVRAMHALDDERIAHGPSAEAYTHLQHLGWDVTLTTFDGVGHRMSDEMNAMFHEWLAATLRRVVEDAPPAPTLDDATTLEPEELGPPTRVRARRPPRVRRPASREPRTPPRQRPPRPRRPHR